MSWKDWRTPDWLFDALHREFEFTVDAASSDQNAKLTHHWTRDTDGLGQPWAEERVFCNPPYGSGVGQWVAKAIRDGGFAALLVPARTETVWFHGAIEHASELRFIRGRVAFDLPIGRTKSTRGNRPSWSSVVLIFQPDRRPLRITSMECPDIRQREVLKFPLENSQWDLFRKESA